MPWIISIIGAFLIVWLIVPGGFFFPALENKTSSKQPQQVEKNSEVENLKKQLQEKEAEIKKLRQGNIIPGSITVTYQKSLGLCIWPIPQNPGNNYHEVVSSHPYPTRDGLFLIVYVLKDIRTGLSTIAIDKSDIVGFSVGEKITTTLKADETKEITNKIGPELRKLLGK